ncbi:MAG TPA: ABC transporter permease subunit [Thermoplasmata archaeon]|nr:ABC transporter permease subunit [Thermoplasmata archaeon]
MSRGADGRLALGVVAGFVALVALLPVVVLFSGAVAHVGGLGGIGPVVAQPANSRALENSLEQGGLSAGFAVLFGYPAGVFLGRYEWPGRSLVRSLLLVPFLLPSLIVVFGVLDLFGPSGTLSGAVPALGFFGSGIPAVVAANLFFNIPIVILLTATGCEGASPELEETTATLGGSPARAYWDVWARPTAVGAAAGGLLTFLFSALSFAPPLLLCGTGSRCYTLEAQVYVLDQTFLEPNAAAVLALVMVLVLALPTALYLLLVARLRSNPGRRSARRRRAARRSPAFWGLASVTALVLGAEGALLAAVLYRTAAPRGGFGAGAAWSALFSAQTTAHLGVSAVGALANTLFFAVVAALIAIVLGVVAGFGIVGQPGRAVPLGLLLFVPLLLSPIVLAFALASFFRALASGASTVWILVVLSQAILALPFALQSLEIPLAALSPAGRDAARTLGATGWGAFLDADLPRVRDGLVTVGLFAFAFGLGEFTATNFLVPPSLTTLPVALYALTEVRLFPVADAAAGLLLLVSLAVFVALVIGGRRVEL